jgi:hypothetical protein
MPNGNAACQILVTISIPFPESALENSCFAQPEKIKLHLKIHFVDGRSVI